MLPPVLVVLLLLALCGFASVAAASPACNARNLTALLHEPGTWTTQPGHVPVWSPGSCLIPTLSHQQTTRCLGSRRVVVMGNSTSRGLFKCLVKYVTKQQHKGKDVVPKKPAPPPSAGAT